MDFHESIKQQLAAICAVPVSRIRRDAMLIEYGLDSIRSVELVVAMEERFSIEIPDVLMERMRTVDDVIELIGKQIERGSYANVDAIPVAA
jgi:acyl carrier protein